MLSNAFKTKTNKSIEAALAGHIKSPEDIRTFDELSYVFKKSNEQIALRFDIKSLLIILFKPLQYIRHRIRMRRLQDAATEELAGNFSQSNKFFADLDENITNDYESIIIKIARTNMTDDKRAAMIGDLVGRYAQKQWHEQKSYIAFAIEECYSSAVNSASIISILEMFFSRSFLSKYGIYIKDTKTPMQILKALVHHSKRSEKGQCNSEITISSCKYLIENIDKDMLFADIDFLANLFSFFGKDNYIMQLMNSYSVNPAETTRLEVIETLYSTDKAIPEVLFDYINLDTRSCMAFFARIAENIPKYIFHQIKHNQDPHYLFSLIEIYSEKSWEDDRYKNLLYDIYLKYSHLFKGNPHISPSINLPRHLIRLSMDDPESKFDTYNNYLAHFLYQERYEATKWGGDFYNEYIGYLNLSTEDCIKFTINEPFSCLVECLDGYRRTHQDLYTKKFIVFAEVLIRFNFNCWATQFSVSHIPKEIKYHIREHNVMYSISNLLANYKRTMPQDKIIDRLIEKYIRLFKIHFDECKKMNQNCIRYFDKKLFSRLTVPLENTKPKYPLHNTSPDTHASSIPSNTPPQSNASSDRFTYTTASDTVHSNQQSSFFTFSKAKFRNAIGMPDLDGDYKHYNKAINHLNNEDPDAAKKSISKISRKFFHDKIYNQAANDRLLKILSHKNISRGNMQSILDGSTLNRVILTILDEDIMRISVDYKIASMNVKSNQQLGTNITGGANAAKAREATEAFKEAKQKRDEELLKYKNSDAYKNMLLSLKLYGVIDDSEYEPKDLRLHLENFNQDPTLSK